MEKSLQSGKVGEFILKQVYYLVFYLFITSKSNCYWYLKKTTNLLRLFSKDFCICGSHSAFISEQQLQNKKPFVCILYIYFQRQFQCIMWKRSPTVSLASYTVNRAKCIEKRCEYFHNSLETDIQTPAPFMKLCLQVSIHFWPQESGLCNFHVYYVLTINIL